MGEQQGGVSLACEILTATACTSSKHHIKINVANRAVSI
jgi:hypothetical protein